MIYIATLDAGADAGTAWERPLIARAAAVLSAAVRTPRWRGAVDLGRSPYSEWLCEAR